MTPLAALSRSFRWHSLPPLWLVVLVLVPAVFLSVRFFYRREAGRLGRRKRIALGLLRVTSILLVLAALFGPYAETIEGEYYKRHLVLCIDTSGSMGIKETYAANPDLAKGIRSAAGYPAGADLGQRDRLTLAKDLLAADRGYLEQLLDRFHVHVYAFGSGCASVFEPREGETSAASLDRLVRELPKLTADGTATRIGSALRDLVRTFHAKNEPVAGVLLFTDGRQTGGPGPVDEAAEAKRYEMPVFPVAMGDPSAAVNIGVSRIDAPEVALAGDEVFFTATVHARGLQGTRGLVAEMVDPNGVSLGSILDEPVYVDLLDNDQPVKASFRHTFDKPGRYTLKIGVPPDPNEAVREDNFQIHFLRVVELKMRVLIVTGKPDWNYRFLLPLFQRAQGMIEWQSLLLDADAEWPQEVSQGIQPLTVFPQEKRDLAEYDVIIFMDVDPNNPRISPDGSREQVLAMLENWVKRGGGLVLEAGEYIPERYSDPPLNALLPVIPSGLPDHQRAEMVAPRTPKRFFLTPAGETHPILRVVPDPAQVRDFWRDDQYATEYYWYAPARAKSSATVLAVRRDEGEWRPSSEPPEPLIAIQDYGLGKVLWLGTNEFWRMRKYVENKYFWPFWSNTIRHLATYRLLSGNKRIKIWVDRADAHYQVGDSVGIEAKFLDENFEPVEAREEDEASMTRKIKLRTPQGEEEELTLHAVLDNPNPPEGIFSAKLAAGRPGTYSLVAEPQDRDEEVAETTFVVEDTTLEKTDPLLDLGTLKAIAAASGGRVLKPDEFRRLLSDKLVPDASILRSGEPRRTDLWDRGYLLVLVVALLAAEWILRRLNLLL